MLSYLCVPLLSADICIEKAEIKMFFEGASNFQERVRSLFFFFNFSLGLVLEGRVSVWDRLSDAVAHVLLSLVCEGHT